MNEFDLTIRQLRSLLEGLPEMSRTKAITILVSNGNSLSKLTSELEWKDGKFVYDMVKKEVSKMT